MQIWWFWVGRSAVLQLAVVLCFVWDCIICVAVGLGVLRGCGGYFVLCVL